MDIVDEKIIDLTSHGVVVLIRRDGKYLLLKESRDLLNGHYGPPHGRMETTDVNEEACVSREVKEETGLSVKPIRKLVTIPADTKVKTVSFWLAEETELSEIKIDPGESSEYGWYTPGEALSLTLYPGTKIFFEMLVSGEVILS